MSSPLPPFPWETKVGDSWTPPPGVTEHTGAPLSADYSFFAAPPAEIGEIRSAYTNLKRGEKLTSHFARWRAVSVAAAFGVAVAIGLELAARVLTSLSEETHLPRAFWAVVPGALLGTLLWRLTRASGTCNFVGSAGCAELVGAAGGKKIYRRRVLRFTDADALAAAVTRHFRRTEYTYTDYAFRWFAPNSEKPCFEITGSHAANLGPPPTGNYYHFGRAAESAWCTFIIPAMEAELKLAGYVSFYLGNKRWARLGRGLIEIEEEGGAVHRCEAGNIGAAKLQGGSLSLTRRAEGSEFFGPLGVNGYFFFDLGAMHNSRLFLLALEKSVGLKIS